jgi:nucleoside-diphosphate-sugar epimerase
VRWADIRDAGAVQSAVEGQDAVAHLAFILPPLSERDARLSQAVNVEGAKNLVSALEARSPQARLVYASSYALYGDTRTTQGLLSADSPVTPLNNYNRHKIEVEALLKASKLRSCVLRLGAVLSAESMLGAKIDPTLIFDIPYDCRQEFVHGEDTARAIAACFERDDVWGRVLLIGAGPSGQLRYLDLINRSLEVMGVGSLPKEAFSTEARQGGGWMDTSESQRLLDYQRWTFEAHLEDLGRKAGYRRVLARVFAPLVRWYLVRGSPYLRGNRA